MDHRPRTERVRWLAAASIVASIGVAAAVVHLWPAGSAPAPLAARALMLTHAPALPETSAVAVAPPPAEPRVAGVARRPHVTAVPALVQHAADAPAVSGTAHDAPVSEAPIPPPPTLVSRSLDPVLFTAADAGGGDVGLAVAPPPLAEKSHGLVDLPATAVTRAVTIAGRGIRTGLRATTAAVRAAF